jgi:hypothetical protein
MPRPKKYSSDAEKAKAYRMRKKLAESTTSDQLNQVARGLHRLYKKRADDGFSNYQELIGKTPFETLIRVVLYEALFEKIDSNGNVKPFPGWDKLITPHIKKSKEEFSYSIESDKNPVLAYLVLDLAEDEAGNY